MGNPKYIFKLQKLLELRESHERESQRLFRETMEDLNREKIALNNIKSDIKKYSGINRGEDIIYQKIKRNYIKALELEKKEKEENLIVKSRELEFRRMDLIERVREKKTVEKLKERDREKFFKEIDRVEAINNDEFALYGYMRNLKGGESR